MPNAVFLDLHGNQIGAEGKLILRAACSGKQLNLLLGEAGGGVYMLYEEDCSLQDRRAMLFTLGNDLLPFSDVESSA